MGINIHRGIDTVIDPQTIFYVHEICLFGPWYSLSVLFRSFEGKTIRKIGINNLCYYRIMAEVTYLETAIVFCWVA